MSAQQDDRIPLRFAAAGDAGPHEALLLDDTHPSAPSFGRAFAHFRARAGHGVTCVCCGGRSAAAVALGGLFTDRARGRVPWFTAVVAAVADPTAVMDAVRGDRLVAARYRLVPKAADPEPDGSADDQAGVPCP